MITNTHTYLTSKINKYINMDEISRLYIRIQDHHYQKTRNQILTQLLSYSGVFNVNLQNIT